MPLMGKDRSFFCFYYYSLSFSLFISRETKILIGRSSMKSVCEKKTLRLMVYQQDSVGHTVPFPLSPSMAIAWKKKRNLSYRSLGFWDRFLFSSWSTSIEVLSADYEIMKTDCPRSQFPVVHIHEI